MIKAKFTKAEVAAVFYKKVKALENAIIMRLCRLGGECVNNAKDNRGYEDQTSNLVNSIGYVVLAGGQEVKSKFLNTVVSTRLRSRNVKSRNVIEGGGASVGISLARQISSRFPTGYALIVVAGMDYAFYVEATGRNVLSSAEHLAKKQLPIMLQQLKSKSLI